LRWISGKTRNYELPAVKMTYRPIKVEVWLTKVKMRAKTSLTNTAFSEISISH
jgi:ABC-type siderophore export system fused ATPase/permease subunit